MNWENLDDFIGEEEKDASLSENKVATEKMQAEEEDKRTIQLQKYQDPSKDVNRQALMALINRFGELIVQNHTEEIKDTLLAENCECFFFNFLDGDNVSYIFENSRFSELYKGARILERKVRKTSIDSDRNAVFQICDCRILKSDGVAVITQVTFELLTFHDGKIMRYRAGFASYIPEHGPKDPFEPSKKDLKLAKVKELNYALAGQPDLEKMASLLSENVEYKILDWDNEKVHIFHKHDFAEGFRNLEERYTLKCIVPYEVYSDREYIVGTYEYHLETKGINSGKEYIWLSTCVYSFDKDLNIVHINQQGDLFPKDEVSVPFEAFDRKKIENKVNEFMGHSLFQVELFYSNNIDFNSSVSRFAPLISPFLGTFQGLEEICARNAKVGGRFVLEWCKAVDIFVDSHDPSYDVAFILSCRHGMLNEENYKFKGKHINFFNIIQYCFENGKLAKMYQFDCDIPEPIPSPYEDPDFEGVTIQPRSINSHS